MYYHVFIYVYCIYIIYNSIIGTDFIYSYTFIMRLLIYMSFKCLSHPIF